MEVATGDHIAFDSEDQWVIGDGISFDDQYLRSLTELGQASAHDLRLATQGVRILNLAAVLVGVGDFTALAEQVSVGGSTVDLAFLATRGVDACVERRARPQNRFNSQSTDRQCASEQIFALEQTTQCISGGYLRAVEQRQPFLGSQCQWRQAGDFQRLGCFQPFALVTSLAFTQQHQRHVGQGCEVAGCTDRTFQRNVRINLGVDQSDQCFDDGAADAGETTAQAIDLEHHDQPDQRVTDRFANTGSVRQNQ